MYEIFLMSEKFVVFCFKKRKLHQTLKCFAFEFCSLNLFFPVRKARETLTFWNCRQHWKTCPRLVGSTREENEKIRFVKKKFSENEIWERKKEKEI